MDLFPFAAVSDLSRLCGRDYHTCGSGFSRADTGVPIPAGSWTLALTRGFPAEANGWEQLVYAPVLKRSIMFSQYHQRNSEPNESMVAYNFETNSWEVIDMGGNFHTEAMPEGGESQGYFDFNPNNNTIIYHCCTTGSNQPENVDHTWWYDVLGQSGRDKQTSAQAAISRASARRRFRRLAQRLRIPWGRFVCGHVDL